VTEHGVHGGGRCTVGEVPEPADAERARADQVRADQVRGLIDLTDLADDHSPDGIASLCERARKHRTAAVCVWPEFVVRCVDSLDGSGVRVATVVNFPGGAEPVAQVVGMTEKAIADGADDIDVVLPYRAFAGGDDAGARELLAAVRAVVPTSNVLKVILETGELESPDLVAAASRLAIGAGADFIKTSTGKTPVGATPEAAHVMLSAIAEAGRPVGLKPSGGIRTVEEAGLYLDLAAEVMGAEWAAPQTFRFGASGLLNDVLRVLGEGGDEPSTGSY